ncbi:MAG: adenine phosphoribosyltransferase [Candidatus Euphemobacter frigidus]|nr:adenine phosphoribosyltransferase [Candidatus Euphemobacter frigidus]MDP8274943.1 adenine phosphoribosyltransferase [Candidatus Euphemobacter frigidus]
MSREDLKKAIRDIPDFPEEGIIFKDITTLISNPLLFKEAIDLLVEEFTEQEIDQVVCVEARGFIFGAVLAYKLGAGLVPVRKEGKLPHKTRKASYALEYGTATVEIHEDAIQPGTRVLIVDDLLATGGTLAATVELVKQNGGEIVGVAVLIELDFLNGRDKLKDTPVFSLIHY